jgi:hypothetical protein
MVEDEVMGERFYDLGVGWVGVVINLVLGGLGIFTDMGSNKRARVRTSKRRQQLELIE